MATAWLSENSDEQTALHGLGSQPFGERGAGVTQGFERHLDIVGIGYRAEVKGKIVMFTLGLFASHRDAHSGRSSDHHRKADAPGGERRG